MLWLLGILLISFIVIVVLNICSFYMYILINKHKKDKKNKQVSSNDYSNDIEFLLFTINYKMTTKIRYLEEVKGIKNINSDLFKELLKTVTKESYEFLSEDYKLLLLNHFSAVGLNDFIITNVEMILRDYIKQNNILLKN